MLSKIPPIIALSGIPSPPVEYDTSTVPVLYEDIPIHPRSRQTFTFRLIFEYACHDARERSVIGVEIAEDMWPKDWIALDRDATLYQALRDRAMSPELCGRIHEAICEDMDREADARRDAA